MTLDEAVIEETLREYCAAEDADKATPVARISIWLAIASREGAVDVLRKAAARRRGSQKAWLLACADHVAKGGEL